MFKRCLYILLLFLLNKISIAQDSLWHGIQRELHYRPRGGEFVKVNGNRRFNRALYGGNTGFRVEAGDLPEFALYLPGMGGNIKLGLVQGKKSKWLTEMKILEVRYRPGSMYYKIDDSLLRNGYLVVTFLSRYDAEAILVKIETINAPEGLKLFVSYGGVTGKRFTRDGDIGADPESSFDLIAENCKDNVYSLSENSFKLSSSTKAFRDLSGVFPNGTELKITSTPYLTAGVPLVDFGSCYFLIQTGTSLPDYSNLSSLFQETETKRGELAARVRLHTPDNYINALGGALSVAADAIWESPSYLHGAVAWRMRLNGWRGAYVADVLGWHDRAREHFSSYARSQLTTPSTGPVVNDTALHLARQQEKLGNSLFSSGYISRNPNGIVLQAHHYDMNLVFIDQLLNHCNWTGDTAYVKQMWPLLKRHLEWEKRNFDMDGDGLYDSYAAIWASDALQYSGGGVTHSSAYNYRANKIAAELAKIIGEDGTVYKAEADKILKSVNKNLWLPTDGWYAEYKDLLGNKLVHPSAGLWTIYHAIDSKLPDAFQAYQCLRYVDNHIPHIPVRAKGLDEKDLYLLSTTNWQPYTWSLNNVVLAENLHTALAYWQGNRSEEAFRLWRSAIIETMYLSASPGGFEQLSFYDAIRGELYRDFADPIGMAGRSLIEGLFGIEPDALHDTLTIRPGLPTAWEYADLETPDIAFGFQRKGNVDTYTIRQAFTKKLNLKLLIGVARDEVAGITINGVKANWRVMDESVARPMVEITTAAAEQYKIVITYAGKIIAVKGFKQSAVHGKPFRFSLPTMKVLRIHDPESVLDKISINGNSITATPRDNLGPHTIFLQVEQGKIKWWQPVHFLVNAETLKLGSYLKSISYKLPKVLKVQQIDLRLYFNDKVTNIFKHEYRSPRPISPTLQLPWQGIGNWAYPLVTANIDDSGLRKKAGLNNEIKMSEDVSFSTPGDSSMNNIVFTSQWDNFPKSVTIPLSGRANKMHLLMAGTTNPMQSRITNGSVVVNYADGTNETLKLENPETWWPIEQDYYRDDFAFHMWDEMPLRLYLKEGVFARGLPSYETIKGFSNRAIDGGAATVFEIYLDKKKTLRSLTVNAIANDVIIGLMAVTLERIDN